eukprot:Amastigsp_a2616_39.p1 type:complete len:281 gc:universal Amastigsp_a2616_39:108-950(+)
MAQISSCAALERAARAGALSEVQELIELGDLPDGRVIAAAIASKSLAVLRAVVEAVLAMEGLEGLAKRVVELDAWVFPPEPAMRDYIEEHALVDWRGAARSNAYAKWCQGVFRDTRLCGFGVATFRRTPFAVRVRIRALLFSAHALRARGIDACPVFAELAPALLRRVFEFVCVAVASNVHVHRLGRRDTEIHRDLGQCQCCGFGLDRLRHALRCHVCDFELCDTCAVGLMPATLPRRTFCGERPDWSCNPLIWGRQCADCEAAYKAQSQREWQRWEDRT